MRVFLRLRYIELDELPGTSARRRNLLLIYLGSFFAVVDFVATFLGIGLASHGHLKTSLLDWIFNTPLGVLACTVLAILVVGLPLVALQWQGGLIRGQLAQAPDMTDAAPDAWEEVSVRRSVERQAGLWIGIGRRERRMNRALLILALGLALALMASWVVTAISAVPTAYAERCGSNGCVPYYPIWMLATVVVPGVLALMYIAQTIWIARVEHACGIWLRHRRAVVNGSSLCYIRKPGVSGEQAARAIHRFARAARRPAARGCLITIFAFAPFILFLPALTILSAWLRLQWVP